MKNGDRWGETMANGGSIVMSYTFMSNPTHLKYWYKCDGLTGLYLQFWRVAVNINALIGGGIYMSKLINGAHSHL